MKVDVEGDFSNTYDFLNKAAKGKFFSSIQEIADQGVEELSEATPVDTGKTAASWYSEVKAKGNHTEVNFCNDNRTESGIPVVNLLIYGHGTGWGGYVNGNDFVTPIAKRIQDQVINNVWEEVTR